MARSSVSLARVTGADRPIVYMHIGAPKTGTTYLQNVLHNNRPALRRAGLLYPGTGTAHFWASLDLRGAGFRGHFDPHVPGSWNRIVTEVRRWRGRSLIDHESFGAATAAQIDRALEDLSFAEVHLIYTARDLARQLPAAWQERIKNRSTQTYAEFLGAVRAGRRDGGEGARQFWATHGTPRLLRRWSRNLPPERVHIVTVPPPDAGSTELWRRFASLLGLNPDDFDATTRKGANTSLGAAEAAVMRRFNVAIEHLDVPWPAYAAAFKQELAPALSRRGSDRIELPEYAYDWAVDWSKRMVEELRDAGYDIVGDLDDLIPRSRPTGLNPDTVPASQQAEVAIEGMVNLVSLVLQTPTAARAVRRS
jgi:hypothetical protein